MVSMTTTPSSTPSSFEFAMPGYEMPEALRDSMLRLSKMLCDATRLRIAYYLTNESELNVSQLCERVGQTQPAVSHHLAMMRSHGIVEARRAGRQIFYSLRGERLREMLRQLFRSAAGSE
jgi:ArsR family transcriptional regulator